MELERLMIRQLINQYLPVPVHYLDAVKDLCGMQPQFLPGACHALAICSDDFFAKKDSWRWKSWSNRGTVYSVEWKIVGIWKRKKAEIQLLGPVLAEKQTESKNISLKENFV